MENGTSFKSLMLGFAAGVLATLTAHELIKMALVNAEVIQRVPWNMQPAAITGIPQIASDTLWGGVWGAIFALVLGDVPKGSMTLRGIILGILGPALVGVFLLVPILKGGPIFMGGDPRLIASVLLILAGYGATTAWLYGFFTAGCRLP
ncbi:MAG: hypothetical protein WC807_03250 [Hyphomicrobium sp.]|jgi:hypothetical protein